MSDDTVLSTSIAEPSPTAGEAEMLLFSLDRSRAQFAWKVGGLDTATLHAPHPPSAMTLGGLIKHLALVEDQRTAEHLGGPGFGAVWSGWDGPEWEWRSAADDSASQLYALWRDAVERSRAAWTRALAEGGLDAPASSGQGTLRRVLVDLTDEYARHVGHADLMREAIDGLVGEDPPQGDR
ncbi:MULTISPECIES: DUF664 domain-containing protein [unclassified Actinotalea]|uniref:mycothiol transferase n=1 Tax=unclassified Actinotalea TaxID=2638618 RepID=UPI0015F6F681|nr:MULTISPECIES: DUF664 domain-containing protein [unclassified Actinotalea]